MTPEEFKAWRAQTGLTQQGAADVLGISKSSVELYDKGVRRDDGRPVEIPIAVEIASFAMAEAELWMTPAIQGIVSSDDSFSTEQLIANLKARGMPESIARHMAKSWLIIGYFKQPYGSRDDSRWIVTRAGWAKVKPGSLGYNIPSP